MLSIVFMFSLSAKNESRVPYSEIISYFDEYRVSKFTLDLSSGQLVLSEVEGVDSSKLPIVYKVPNVSIFLDDIQGKENYRKEYNKLHPNDKLEQDYYPIQDNSWLINIVPTILLLIGMVVLFYFMMKQAGGGGKISQFGKANVKAQSHSARKTTFADVAGAEEEKAEMAEIVDFLKNPKKYAEIGARIPKGVLLLGPPGTGKTLLARAVAGEAGVPFFSISGSDFVEMFVGVGASRVRDLFEQAKKNSPSIVFIDEIDAVGRHRGAGLGGGHDEREQTLNQLLVEMDGFAANESVIVIAATNRRDILDPALLRPGRFDRQIVVGYPDVKGREAILKVHTRNKPLAPDVDLAVIAKTSVGFTGADLENLVNEASLLAARKNRRAITKEDIEEATIKVIAGPEKKSKVVTEKEKRLTAYHEAGHAICTYFCKTQDKVHQVSIIPRGMAGGYTMSLPEHDKSFVSKKEMQENIITLLGGRVAEKLILDDISTGASNDIERATNIARSMVTRYGFSDKLGPIVYGHDQGEVFLGRDFSSTPNYSENVAAEIDAEIREIIEEAYEKAKDILEENISKLHLVAKHLLKYEKIDGDEFEKLMKGEISEEEFELSKEIPENKEIGKVIDVTVDDDSSNQNGGGNE
ncbi:MAG TPA: ATP-dependent zinc metalloprotease FtsH [Oscillospiraceae bacterium]|nr:ATP-dependent zinc metalloprotease FtsH [Oscillospiraceae bacterium]